MARKWYSTNFTGWDFVIFCFYRMRDGLTFDDHLGFLLHIAGRNLFSLDDLGFFASASLDQLIILHRDLQSR